VCPTLNVVCPSTKKRLLISETASHNSFHLFHDLIKPISKFIQDFVDVKENLKALAVEMPKSAFVSGRSFRIHSISFSRVEQEKLRENLDEKANEIDNGDEEGEQMRMRIPTPRASRSRFCTS